MKEKCDKCGREAKIQLTDIIDGQKIVKHLCEECAVSEGVTFKAQLPISEILEELVLQSAAGKQLGELRCEVCGISFQEFRQGGLLGCPNDYKAFENVLVRLLERAHDGGSFHVGRIPANAGESERKQAELLQLQGQLREAVSREQYERAAQLRDRIRELEGK